MENFKIYARILRTNVVGQTAFFKIQIRGMVFAEKKVPFDYPVQTLASEDEFTIHFGDANEMTETEIAVLVPDRQVTIEAERDEMANVTIKKIIPNSSDSDMPFGRHIAVLEKMY